MAPQWDPEHTLNLANDSRCVGHAPSKGRKCMMPIRYENVMRCDSIIVEISKEVPDPVLLAPKLRRLAVHGLCVRFHQSQADAMVRKWSSRMRDAFPLGTVVQYGLRERRRVDRDDRVSVRSESSVTSATVSLGGESEVETLQATIAAMQEMMRTAQRRLDMLQCATPSRSSRESSVSRVSTSDISTLDLNLSRSSTSQSLAAARRPAPVVPASRAAAPSPPPSSRRQTSMPTTPPASTRSSPGPRITASIPPNPVTPASRAASPSPPPSNTRQTSLLPTPPPSNTRQTVPPLTPPASTRSSPAPLVTATPSPPPSSRQQTSLLPTPPASTSSSPAPRLIAPNPRCNLTHARRLPIDEECPICYEEKKMSEADDGALVWCKDGCGRSVHKECFDVWRDQCIRSERAPTCIHCRKQWQGEGGCGC